MLRKWYKIYTKIPCKKSNIWRKYSYYYIIIYKYYRNNFYQVYKDEVYSNNEKKEITIVTTKFFHYEPDKYWIKEEWLFHISIKLQTLPEVDSPDSFLCGEVHSTNLSIENYFYF